LSFSGSMSWKLSCSSGEREPNSLASLRILGMFVGTFEKCSELEEEEPLDELAKEGDAAETKLLSLKALTIRGFPTKAPPRRNTTPKTNNRFKILERFDLFCIYCLLRE
jgi:hypothetical protein